MAPYFDNIVSPEARKVWVDEAKALGLDGLDFYFLHISGCDTCRNARNAVRAARLAKAGRPVSERLYGASYPGLDSGCGDADCDACYPFPASITDEYFAGVDEPVFVKSAESLRATDFDDLMELVVNLSNLSHVEGVSTLNAQIALVGAINKIAARIEANS